MTVKQYLKQAQALDLRIKADLEELHGLRMLITSASTAGYGGISRSGGVGDPISARVLRLVALEQRINDEIDRYVDKKDEIRASIAAIGDMTLENVLCCRYLSGMTWEQIAVALHYSYRWVLALHGRALREFERVHTSSHSPMV